MFLLEEDSLLIYSYAEMDNLIHNRRELEALFSLFFPLKFCINCVVFLSIDALVPF